MENDKGDAPASTAPVSRLTTAQVQLSLQGWSGPLPPPAMLQDFEAVVPGSAAQIVEEFKAEASHRRRLENRQSNLVVWETHIGQALAIIFVLVMAGLIAFAIRSNAPWVAGLLGTGVIGAGIVAFLKGRNPSE